MKSQYVIMWDIRADAALRKTLIYFTNRVVSIWNSLPNDVAMADKIHLFKNHLDKFWSSCEFVYSYRAQAFGTGSVK